MRSIRFLLCLLLCAGSIGRGFAAEGEAGTQTPPAARSQVVSVGINGTITRKHYDQVRAVMDSRAADPLPTGLILLLNSPGGDGLAAMDLGRLARQHKAHVFVTGKCASACLFVFAGGVFRTAPAGALGIHRGRLTRSVSGKGEVDLTREDTPKLDEILALVERRAGAYFAEMGLPPAFFAAMQAVPSNSMRWLSTEEASNLGLLGFEPKYLEERSAMLWHRYGISPEEYVERSTEVPVKCGGQYGQHTRFVRCYREQLLGRPDASNGSNVSRLAEPAAN